MFKSLFTSNKKFTVMLRGENFVIDKDGIKVNYGFITTRIVKASSLKEAEDIAVDLVKNDDALMDMLSEQNWEKPPTIYLQEIYKASFWKKLGGGGYTFYQM